MDTFEVIDDSLTQQMQELKEICEYQQREINEMKNIIINITPKMSEQKKDKLLNNYKLSDEENNICDLVHEKVEKIKNKHKVLKENTPIDISNTKSVKITQRLIDDAYKQFKSLIKNKTFNFNSAKDMALFTMYALQLSMEIIKADKQYRVELALSVLRKYISEHVESPEAEIANTLIEAAVPTLIDTMETVTEQLPNLFKKLTSCCKC